MIQQSVQKKVLSGDDFRFLLASGLSNLRTEADEINKLNVFPIPDGDTGDNMVSTMEGGVNSAGDAWRIGETASSAANGMLLGARGNSGVILSRMFAGIASALEGKESASAAELASAFKEGVKCAYSSVVDPVEGTMLTVMRIATDYAFEKLNTDSTPQSFFLNFYEEAERTLERTPELLHILKEAGTVDSGGAGVCCIIRGFLQALSGETGDGKEGLAANSTAHESSTRTPDISLFTENSELKLGYCTELLLRLTVSKTDLNEFSLEKFKEDISTLGDSVVVFKQDTVIKVHIHTTEPWKVLQYAQGYGEFLTTKIENMDIQHSEKEIRAAMPRFRKNAVRKAFGTVAVCCGDGMKKAFHELGADIVIDYESEGTPSVEEFLNAFDAVNADCIFVLPNNCNILQTAREAAGICASSEIRVVNSRNLGEGYVALSALEYESGDADSIYSLMQEEMAASVTGTVARAIRDAVINGVAVQANDFIGYSGKQLMLSSKDRVDAALSLTEKLGANERSFIIVFYGSGMTGDDKTRYADGVRDRFPDSEFYEFDGGQSVYDIIIVLQ